MRRAHHLLHWEAAKVSWDSLMLVKEVAEARRGFWEVGNVHGVPERSHDSTKAIQDEGGFVCI
jgi:hypothetical protein